jgi:putative chitinase
LAHPDLLLTPRVGIQSACWYWRVHGLDAHDDDTDVRIETRKINGGETGLAHRQAYFDKCIQLLEAA